MRGLHTSPHLRTLLLIAFLLAGSGTAFADLIIFKDGFILYGKVTQESETIVDPGGQQFTARKGSIYVLDGARKISFPFAQVQDVDSKNVGQNTDVAYLGMRVARYGAIQMYPLTDMGSATPWDDRWERKYRITMLFNNQPREIDVEQRLTLLSPQFARADAKRYAWTACYLTSELGPETARSLIEKHPDMKPKGDKDDVKRRFFVYRFFAQGGWYDEAERELQGIAKDLPDEKEKLAAAQEHLKELKSLKQIEEIERGCKASRHLWTQEQLDKVSLKDVDEKLSARVRAIAGKYETGTTQLKQARRFLMDLPSRLLIPAERAIFSEAATAILAELNFDNVERLEEFVARADKAERDRGQGREVDLGPAPLMSLAVSGWLQGKMGADTKVEVAVRLWQARRFVLQYQNTHDASQRERLLRAYEQQKYDVLPPDELSQVVRFLPPPEPEKEISTDPVEFSIGKPSAKKKGITYTVQFPPEYSHGRPCPVLIALHNAGEEAKEMVRRCGEQASRNGYILVAPTWSEGGNAYSFSTEEHAIVLQVLRDLRRRCQVDSDRVFLLGFGKGADMAYDVGLSHPDLFAGVIPVCGIPQMFSHRYSNNAQFLPFYVLEGNFLGDTTKNNRKYLDGWITRGFPTLHVEYMGRGMEWFSGELPTMFDWMNRKRRSSAFPDLGSGEREFKTMRQTDNRFYWLSTDSIRESCCNDAANWNPSLSGATVHARIGEGNQVHIHSSGLKQITVWFGRDVRGRDMIDFTKELTITVNGTVMVKKKSVSPSLATMLEDFYQRGDRQRLFLVKESVEFR